MPLLKFQPSYNILPRVYPFFFEFYFCYVLRKITNIVIISKTNILQCWVKFEGSTNFLRKLLDYSSFFFHKHTISIANRIGDFWNFCRCDFETAVCSYVRRNLTYVFSSIFPSSCSLECSEISRNLHIEMWSIYLPQC